MNTWGKNPVRNLRAEADESSLRVRGKEFGASSGDTIEWRLVKKFILEIGRQECCLRCKLSSSATGIERLSRLPVPLLSVITRIFAHLP